MINRNNLEIRELSHAAHRLPPYGVSKQTPFGELALRTSPGRVPACDTCSDAVDPSPGLEANTVRRLASIEAGWISGDRD